MRKLKTSLTTITLVAVALFTLTLVGCTTNSITGAQLEHPKTVQSTPNGPSSSDGTSYEYNGADVDHESHEAEESGENDEPILSTDPDSHYNL